MTKVRKCGRPLLCVVFLLLVAGRLDAQVLKSPEQYFGFPMGADYKLVKWPQILEYFAMLDEASEKIQVMEIGKSSMGNPIIVAAISSAANLGDLGRYKTISQRLARPRGLSEEEASRLIAEGRVIAAISCSIHASEIAASQMSMELAHSLLTSETAQVKEILDKVILLLFPSHNPDGNNMVVDWYNKNLGTPYELSPMPWLYQKYVGHDNNRDWFMLNLQETRVITRFYFQEWFPQILYDIHQMGRNGARLFVPPFLDPLNPNVHPLIWRGNNLIGANMYRELEERGHTGVATSISYTSWWQGNSLQQPWFHNMVSVLTEGATVNVATPVYQKVEELKGNGAGLPEYTLRANFTHPWPGGWWRLRDLVEYELAASMAFLDTGAKYRENFLRNFYRMGVDAIAKGKTEPPYAYIVPADQHDANTAAKTINVLIEQGAEIHVATEAFMADNIRYPKDSYVILMSQPFRPFVKDIMEKQVYPDLRAYPGGPPVPPYDVAGWTLPMQMGVRSVGIVAPFEAKLAPVTRAALPPGKVEGQAGYAYILGHEANDSLTAVNRLLKAGHDVYWSRNSFTSSGRTFAAGTMIVPAKPGVHAELAAIAKDLSLQIHAANAPIAGEAYKLRPLRLALYNPWGGNMDEGWCKWLFEEFEFPFIEVRNAELRAGDLKARYDVILLADQRPESVVDGIPAGTIPPEYAGGIGSEGVANLREFVGSGGTLIALGATSALAIDALGLPVNDVLEGVKPEDFFCPGSILEVEVDTSQPIGFGMESRAGAFFARSSAFEVLPSFKAGKAQVVVNYPAKNPLMSGWILGEQKLHDRAAAVDVAWGKGRVVLFGFRVQNRAQPHGTFKLLFNALYYGPATLVQLPPGGTRAPSPTSR